MSFPGEQFVTQLALRLGDKTTKELRYFRHFDDHIQNFALENNSLVAKRNEVKKDIEDAQKNENQVEDGVQNWIEAADEVIRVNTKIKQTWSYGWCPYWQYRQGKRLAKRIQATKDHMQKCNFNGMARPIDVPGIKYHASKYFIDFESRRTKFNQLVEALKDGNRYMIGLQGMGGTGKTTLATQVGKQLEESKAFGKVIFVVVSNPPECNQIRGDIARPLGLDLNQRVEADHSKILWSRLSKNEGKLLIILDDVWEDLSLTEIGIPSGPEHKNCYVLITTRHSKVCQAMRCQQTVHLHTLGEEDALQLFLFHAGSDGDDSLARDFVKECGGLPIAIVALASTLRNWPVGEWNVVLTTLRDSKPFVDVDEDLVKVYNCLKLSYDNLHNEKAKKLFILCSIFPEDYEFPINLIIRLGIGSGIYEEVDEYYAARTQALQLKNKLIDSSLLLKVEENECIKMHDLVREVAQWIAKEDTQVIMDSRTTLKANKRFVFWSANDFPDQFDDIELEILLLWISGNVVENDPEAFFARMSKLKILFLLGDDARKIPSPSLSHSLLSLKNIHTLILDGWEIGDISILMNLQSLVTLEFKSCLIFELPIDMMKLKKLRWLGLRKCEIQENNPFEVIEKCPQLEELYFVGNGYVTNWKPGDDKEIDDEIAPDVSPSTLRMFSIACDGFKRFAGNDNGLIKCFNPEPIKHLISKAMFHYFVGKAEVLELGKIGQMGWKSFIPDIIPVDNGGINNLIKLYLYERDGIEFLIDNSMYHCSNIIVFSRLVELHMDGVDVKKLYWGAMPSGFLGQLQILKLNKCLDLQNIFFDGNLKLPHLRVLEMIDCPMFQPSIFQLCVARSLVRLEELVIEHCKELKILIAYQRLEEEMIVDSHKNYDPLFPELKSLKIKRCDKLKMVLPLLLAGDLPKLKELYIEDCKELNYIFDEYRDMGQFSQQEIMLPFLTGLGLYDVPSFINIFKKCKKCMPRPTQVFKEDSMEKFEKSKTSAFSHALGCCLMVPIEDTNIGVSNAMLEHHTKSQESCVSSKMIETFYTAECLMRQPLRLQNIMHLTLGGCSKLKSLFSVSIATTMIMLEELYIWECEELKHIITNEEEDDVRLNCNSILPKLQRLEVYNCNKLEFIFPSTLSGGLQKLRSIYITGAYELKYVFGKYNYEDCVSTENDNNEPHIHIPALESLRIGYVPNMISIDIMIYQLECLSLQTVEAPKESCASSKMIETSHIAECFMRQPLRLQNIRQMRLTSCSKLKSLFSVSIATTMIMLEELYIGKCEELKYIVSNEEEDDVHLNCNSILPKLQSLNVYECNKLEFIFPFTLFGGLQKLKSIDIAGADELKYVFEKYNDEECVSVNNENNEPRIHLPALESLRIEYVPNMINIGIRIYQMVCPSLEVVEAPKELMSEGAKAFKIQDIVNVETPQTPSLSFQYVLNFCNLRRVNISRNTKLKALFSISTSKNLPQLSRLCIEDCEELVNVVEDNCNDHHHMNYSSFFPKLEDISIRSCNKLEFIFPLSLFGTLQKLKYLEIYEAAELKYIFGKYHEGDYLSNENESDKLHIHLPALEELAFVGVPNIINNIRTKKCQLSFPSLRSIELGDLQEFNGKSFPELMAYLQLNMKAPKDRMKIIKDVQKLTRLDLSDSKIEEVLNLEGVEIEGPVITLSLKQMWLKNLSELRYICKAPKYILSLTNIEKLYIRACKKLRTIFNVSIVKSLPQLSFLGIEDCDELVDIIEESEGDHLHQLCFSKLDRIYIERCNSLKFLFSISTCGMFPKLVSLTIEETSELEQVFIRKQDEIQKMAKMKEVFPKLSYVRLKKLPRLLTICEGIDFQTLKNCKVEDCPKYKEIGQIQEGFEYGDSENQAARNASPNFVESSEEAMKPSVEEVGSSSMSKDETIKEIEAKDPTPALETQALRGSTDKPQMKNTSLHNYKDTKKEGGRVVPDATSKLPTTTFTFQSMDSKLNETAKGPTSEDVMAASMISAELASINSLSATSLIVSQVGGSQSWTCKEIEKEVDEGIPASRLLAATSPDFENSVENIIEDTTPMVARINTSSVHSQAEDSQLDPHAQIASMNETHKQGSQEDEAMRKAAIAIQSTDSMTRKLQLISYSCMTDQNIKDTKEQDLEENCAEDDAVTEIQSNNLDSRKQSTGAVDNLSRKNSALSVEIIKEETASMEAKIKTSFIYSDFEGSQPGPSTMIYKETKGKLDKAVLALPATSTSLDLKATTKETRDTNVQYGPKSEKAEMSNLLTYSCDFKPTILMKANTSVHDVTPSSYNQTCEISELVELKDGEAVLLAKALKLYPQLRLSHGQRTRTVIAFSYRVLIDILLMLTTKTPRTVTTFDKLTLEENLGTATFLGFDKGWIESVRDKVFGTHTFDVTALEEEIQVMKADLETCDITLEQVRKQRVEIKEKIAGVISQLEMVQREFEAVDSQLEYILKDREKLIRKMMEFKGILSAQDRPFGI